MGNEVLEQVKGEIARLTDAVRSRNGDMATLDTDKLAATVADLVSKQVAAQMDEAARRRVVVVRRGELIGPPGFQVAGRGVVEDGKFAGQLVDDVLFANWLMGKASRLGANVRPPSKAMTDVVAKALTPTGPGTGDEYVPTGMAAALWEDMFTASLVVPTLGVVAMPTDPFDLPIGWGDPTWRKGALNTATTPSDPATAKATLTATEQVTEINWAYDLDEDGIIAVLPTLRQMIARSGAEQIDKFAMNADATNAATGNINLDDADPADDSYYLSNGQDGIRHLYLVDNTGQSADINGTLDDGKLRAGISRLGKYGVDVGRCVMFCDPKTYVNGLLALSDVVTVDKYGPAATILTGELSKYQGIAIVPTSAIPEAKANGKVSATASSNTKGQIALVHRDMWRVGFRRELLIEVDRDIKKRQLVLVASFRIALAARGTRSTATHTAGIHGISRA